MNAPAEDLGPFERAAARLRAQHGERFDPSHLHRHLWPYFGQQVRVRIGADRRASFTLHGRLGLTSGPAPRFVLVRQGAPHTFTLGPHDRVIGTRELARLEDAVARM